MENYPLAIVTGAAHRLGRALALSLARQGYAILLHYFSSSEEAVRTSGEIRSIGVPVHLFGADLTKEESINALLSFTDSLPFQSRVLVNSASIMLKKDLPTTTLAEWDLTFAINLRAPFLLSQKYASRMEAGGLIVNISDVGAGKLWMRYPSYVISKSALETLTQLLAKAYAPSIRVNAIAPGLVLPSSGTAEDEWQLLVNRVPLKRATDMTEVSSALEFLLGNEAITGQVITVDGGYSLL
jgi:pteridine reductase